VGTATDTQAAVEISRIVYFAYENLSPLPVVPLRILCHLEGNGGVAAIVKQIPYSIGYVELAYAVKNKLAYGWIKIRLGTS
jgi:hypothetical protein